VIPQTTVVPPFAQAAAAYDLLTCEPDPLGLDCAMFGPAMGLPARYMPLPELAGWLVAAGDRRPAARAVWALVVALARTGSPRWRIAAVALALPALRRRAELLAAAGSRDPQGEAMTAFLAAVDAGSAAVGEWPGR
jgi:hypothetical protein